MTVNADFLISPAYIVPTMMISIRSRWTRIAVPVRVPSVAGSASKRRGVDDREVGLRRSASVLARPDRNRLRAKMLAQAVSV